MNEQQSNTSISPRNKWNVIIRTLIDLPWVVKGVMFVDLGASIAFHIVKIMVMYDLHNINYDQAMRSSLFILREDYYDAAKAHFWALCGVALELNLHTMSVVTWGILAYGIVRADPSWVRAWCMLRRVVIFTMLVPNLAIAFGGETYFTLINTIVFFLYYLEAVLATELVSRYCCKTAPAPVLKSE